MARTGAFERMNLERWRQIEHIFHSARELPPDDRAAFLSRACAGDAGLRDEISSLLSESDGAGDFLAESALSLGISLIAGSPESP